MIRSNLHAKSPQKNAKRNWQHLFPESLDHLHVEEPKEIPEFEEFLNKAQKNFEARKVFRAKEDVNLIAAEEFQVTKRANFFSLSFKDGAETKHSKVLKFIKEMQSKSQNPEPKQRIKFDLRTKVNFSDLNSFKVFFKGILGGRDYFEAWYVQWVQNLLYVSEFQAKIPPIYESGACQNKRVYQYSQNLVWYYSRKMEASLGRKFFLSKFSSLAKFFPLLTVLYGQGVLIHYALDKVRRNPQVSISV